MPDLRLRVGGREYGGWKSVRITRGIEAISGSFELSHFDRWSGQAKPWPIFEEDECELLIDDEQVIAGFVDKRALSYGAAEHSISVSGRDKTSALVDCSALLGTTWEFVGIDLMTLARKLSAPYEIPVKLQAGLVLPRLVSKITIDPGESAFDVLDRACRMVGVLPVADGAGCLLITRAGTARATTALVQGENILGASVDYDGSGRYRRYRVTGQHQGTDEDYGPGAVAVYAEAQDANVRRSSRTLLVRAEGALDAAVAGQRAQWEAKVRAGRAEAVSISVQGWQQQSGRVWPLNALVPVRSPYLGIDGEMLISQATHIIDDSGGTTTTLALKRPDAFLPEPVVSEAATGRWKELNTPMGRSH